ncbi:hypothetical protein TGP89_249698, partial [Toxoplasma gondii p89]
PPPPALSSVASSSVQPAFPSAASGPLSLWPKNFQPRENAASAAGEEALSSFVKIADLRPGDRGVNCVVRILHTILLSSRTLFSGEVTTFSEVLAGDETGTIKLELHGEEQRTACRASSD